MMLKDAGIDPEKFEGTAKDTRAALAFAKRERAARLGLDYNKFSDAQLTDRPLFGVFPTVQIGCHPDAVFLPRFLPPDTDPSPFTYEPIILYRPIDVPGHGPSFWVGLGAEADITG